MKAKYKIGMLVSYKRDADTDAAYGEVTSIVTSANGYSYFVNGSFDTIPEGQVVKAWTAVTSRAKTRKAKVKSHAKKVAEETTAALN